MPQSLRAALCVFAIFVSTSALAADPFHFAITLAPTVSDKPITGRLFVFLSKNPSARGEPRFGPNWFNPEPFFATGVQDLQPGKSHSLDDKADGFPEKLSKLAPGKYRVQALLDHEFYDHAPAHGVGNFYSPVVELDLDPATSGAVSLSLDQVVQAQPFPESQWVKEVVQRSELLSKFLGREVLDRCAVVLPPSYYSQPDKRYPALYIVPGFGGSHREALRYAKNGAPPAGEGEVEFIRVMLTCNCKWGHHVYADSATNGPRGQSLIDELIPHIDRTFRTIAAPTARFVNGHSSGGWSSLWLQVTYPDTFGGVWSTSPDPVTFSDYQQVDLYHNPPLSLYFDEKGQRRPIARSGTRPLLWYNSFGLMDDVLGRGGQLRSFEAVFSPLGADGLPQKLWDRTTGIIDPQVAKAWEAYDIRLKLERNWPTLGPKLKGKLRITTGSLDTFYLDGAVAILAKSLKSLGSDAQVTILAGEDHGSLLTQEFYRKTRREMSAQFLQRHPQ